MVVLSRAEYRCPHTLRSFPCVDYRQNGAEQVFVAQSVSVTFELMSNLVKYMLLISRGTT